MNYPFATRLYDAIHETRANLVGFASEPNDPNVVNAYIQLGALLETIQLEIAGDQRPLVLRVKPGRIDDVARLLDCLVIDNSGVLLLPDDIVVKPDPNYSRWLQEQS